MSTVALLPGSVSSLARNHALHFFNTKSVVSTGEKSLPL